MKIPIESLINAAGSVSPSAKKFSSSYNLVKSIVSSIFLLFLGIVFLFLFLPIGIFFILFSFLWFFTSLNKKRKISSLLKMSEELRSLNLNNEIVKFYFTDISSANSSSESTRFNEDVENVMILTDKKIIFVHVPRVGLSDIGNGNFKKSLALAAKRDDLKEKVKEILEKEGLKNLVDSSRRAYSMNYQEIEKIRFNKTFSKAIFFYRGRKYKYFIRKDQQRDFEDIFKNYFL